MYRRLRRLPTASKQVVGHTFSTLADQPQGSGTPPRGTSAHLAKRLLVVAFVRRVDEVPPLVDLFDRGPERAVAHGADTVRQPIVQRLELRRGPRARRKPGCGCGLARSLGQVAEDTVRGRLQPRLVAAGERRLELLPCR